MLIKTKTTKKFRGEQLYVNMEYSLIELISEFKKYTLNIFLFRKTIRRKKIISATICHQNQKPNGSGGIYKIFKGRRKFSKINIIHVYSATQTYYK